MENIKDKVKDTINIRDILHNWYGVNLSNRDRGPCPFCNYQKDKKALWVSVNENRYHCHHCKQGGDVFNLVMEMDKLEFPAALKKLADLCGIPYHTTPEQEKAFQRMNERSSALLNFSRFWNGQLTPEAVRYLESRRINLEYVNRQCIGLIPENAIYKASKKDLPHLKEMGLLEGPNRVKRKWCNRLFIPFWKNGQIVYFAGRAIADNMKPVQLLPSVEHMGNKPVLGSCRGPRAFIVEGVFDYLTADQYRESNNTMAILGNSKVFDLPPSVKIVDLCFDWDKAGGDFIDKYGLHFAANGTIVNVIARPSGLMENGKDLNDFARTGGNMEKLKALDLPSHLIERLKAEPANIELKSKFFKSLFPYGEIDRDKYLNNLHAEVFKRQGVSKNSIKKEFRETFNVLIKQTVKPVIIDNPDGDKLELPEGFIFSNDKLRSTTGEIIAEKKIYISELLTDYQDGDTYVKIVSSFNGKTIASIEPLSIISNRKEIVNLSKKNFPVTSENAGKITNFLYKFRYANEKRLKPLTASTQLGWNKDFFLFPDRAINNEGKTVTGHFIGNDPPQDVFTSKGDLNTYIDFVRSFRDDLTGTRWVIPVFVLYAALASFILELLKAKVIIIHFTENTGRGKTSIMDLAASVYGKPNYHNLWNDTQTGLVRKAVKHKNFPLLINEGSIIEQKKGLASFLYTLSEGQSRSKARGETENETVNIRHFHNVIISNGETSLLNGTEASGVLMRVNEFFESFGGMNHKFIEKLERTLKNNYGLLIEPFIKKILDLKNRRGSINMINPGGDVLEVKSLEEFPLFENLDKSDGPHSGNLNRKIKSLQPVYIAGCIAEDLFGFGYDPAQVVGFVFDMWRKKIMNEINRASRIMEGIRGFFNMHRANFVDLSGSSGGEDEIKEAAKGNRVIYGYEKENDLMIIPDVFRTNFLRSFNGSDGKNASVILKELKEEGLIEVDKSRMQKSIRIGNRIQRVIYFSGFFESWTDSPDFEKESIPITANLEPAFLNQY